MFERADRAVVSRTVVAKHEVQREHHLTVFLDDVRVEDTVYVQPTVAKNEREIDQSEHLVDYGLNFVLNMVQITAIDERFDAIADDGNNSIHYIGDNLRKIADAVEVAERVGLGVKLEVLELHLERIGARSHHNAHSHVLNVDGALTHVRKNGRVRHERVVGRHVQVQVFDSEFGASIVYGS